jgi:hypothetical protein
VPDCRDAASDRRASFPWVQTGQEVELPTLVHFVGSQQPLRLTDDYQHVNDHLTRNVAAQFTREPNNRRVTIYRESVRFTEEIE